MDQFDLSDIWRTKFPNNITFTWSNKSGTSQSRIDYWLISKNLHEDGIDVDILPTPLSDHEAISINIKLLMKNIFLKSPSYWKLNHSLLLHDEVEKKIKI